MNIFGKRGKQLLTLAGLFGGLIASNTLHAQIIIYVNQAGTNTAQDGNAWATCYHELRDAMQDPRLLGATAASPVEIWVAAGTYKPTSGTNRTVSFVLQSHLRLRGGFNGTEGTISQRPFFRNIPAYETVLSGDIGLAQTNGVTASTPLAQLPQMTFDSNDPGSQDNSQNVLSGYEITDVVLDGLIVTGGNASDTNNYTALQIDGMTQAAPGSSLGQTIVPINRSVAGGGLAFFNAPGWDGNTNPDYGTLNLTVENCIFIDNQAQGFGGAIAVREANVALYTSEFLDNSSDYEGGAFWGQNQLDDAEYCYFANNFAFRSGGAVHLETIPSLRTLNPYFSEAAFEQAFGTTKSNVFVTVQAYQGNVDLTVDGELGFLQASNQAPFNALNQIARERVPKDGESIGKAIVLVGVKSAVPEIKQIMVDAIGGTATKALGYFSAFQTAVQATDFAFQLADLFPGAQNDPGFQQFLSGWDTFYTYFDYTTPGYYLGLLEGLYEDANTPTYEQRAFNLRVEDDGYYNMMPNSRFLFCQFETNQTAGQAGAFMDIYDNVHIEDSRFDCNLGIGNAGAAAFMCYTAPELVSDAFLGNRSALGNSAIVNSYRVQPRILNCTIMNNGSANTNGVALDNEVGADTQVGNSILWGNTNASTPGGGADIFTSTSGYLAQNDTNGYAFYNQAGDSGWAWIGMCDVHYSCVQSQHTTPVEAGDIYIYDPGTVQGIEEYDAAEQLDDQLGTRENVGFFNVGEGTRDILVNPAYGNIDLNPGISADGVTPLAGSPVIGAGALNMLMSAGTNTPLIYDDFDFSVTGADINGEPRNRGAIEFIFSTNFNDSFGAPSLFSVRGQIEMGAAQNNGPGYFSFDPNPFSAVGGTPTISFSGFGSGNGASPYTPGVLNNLYVNANVSGGNGSGTSWANAMRQIPSYINLNSNGVMWIAAGTYQLSGPIVVGDSVSVYGGFAGGETSVSQSDPAHHPTILSGGGGAVELMSIIGNGSPSIIQGLTFTATTNDALQPAALLDEASSIVQNCTFSNITGVAAYDGGLAVFTNCQFLDNSGSPVMTVWYTSASNCTFSNNAGTAVYGVQGTLDGCRFISNSAAGGDGVLVSQAGRIDNCQFSGNSGPAASSTYFTMYNGCSFLNNRPGTNSACSALQVDSGEVDNSLFQQNTGNAVVATAAQGYNVNFQGCQFIQNSGGSALNSSASQIFVSNCRFDGNNSPSGALVLGGGAAAATTVYGSEFYANSGQINGAAIYATAQDLSVFNCTIFSNTLNCASCQGGAGIRFDSTGYCEIINTILDSNAVAGSTGIALEFQQYLGGTIGPSGVIPPSYFLLESSLVQGLTTLGQPYNAPGSYDADPRFVDPVGGNLQLRSNSFAIDGGAVDNFSGGLLTTNDLAGNPRVKNGVIDIGAYEYQGMPAQRPVVSLQLAEYCDNGLPSFSIAETNAWTGLPYEWQINRLDGKGFVDLTNGGINSDSLQLIHPPNTWAGYLYRVEMPPSVNLIFISTNVTLPHFRSIVYVNQNVSGGSGDGSSWSNAMTDLQSAIQSSPTCCQIWVAQGSYTPSGVLGNVGFAPGTDMQIYGGFNGTETSLSQRNPQANLTILQASATPVVQFEQPGIDTNTVVDGFTIQYSGNIAAVQMDQGGPTFANCVITNSSRFGLLLQTTNLVSIANCQFLNGHDTAVVDADTPAVFQNDVFAGNQSSSEDGAFSGLGTSSVQFTNCQFLNNSGAVAGAVDEVSKGSVNLSDCVLSNNFGGSSGALENHGSATVADCLIVNNSAHVGAGAITFGGTNLTVTLSTIVGNTSSGFERGAVTVYSGSWTINSSILYQNQGGASVESSQFSIFGGGNAYTNILYSDVQGLSDDPNYTHYVASSNLDVFPLFVSPSAGNYQLLTWSPLFYRGSFALNGVGVDLNGYPLIPGLAPDMGCYQHQIGTAPPIYVRKVPANQTVCPYASASFSVVGVPGTTNTYQWQEFNGTTYTNIFSSSEELTTSNGITNTLTIAHPANFDGQQFQVLVNGILALPVTLSVTQPPIIYVNAAAAPGGDGTTWATAYQSLSQALGTVATCEQIWVAQGVYTSDLVSGQQPFLLNEVAIYGGFNGTETNLSQRDYVNNVTRLVPGSAQYIMTAGLTGGTLNNSAVLDGFYLSGATNGALLAQSAGPLIANCVFESNNLAVASATCTGLQFNHCTFRFNTNGAAEFNLATNLVLSQCSFSNNSVGNASVLSFDSSAGSVTNCQFAWNQGSAAVYSESSSMVLERCLFTSNSAPEAPAIQVAQGSMTLMDSLVAGNQSTAYGAINVQGGLTLLNDTIADNSGAYGGDGVTVIGNGSLTARNCIFWGNSDSISNEFSVEEQQVQSQGQPVTASFCIVEGLNRLQDPGSDDLSAAPLFVNESAGNYQLTSLSPADGAGSTNGISTDALDFLGNPRLHQGTVDIGAYAFEGTPNPPANLVWNFSSQSVCSGGATAFSVTNLGAPGVSISWLVNTGGGFAPVTNNSYYTVSGASSNSTLLISGIDNSLNGSQYEFILSGSIVFTSAPVTLTVNPRTVIYVDAQAAGTGDGSSWANAFTTLDSALAHSGACSSIWIAQGTYSPARTLTIPPGVELDGGFQSGGTMANRNPSLYPTIIHGAQLQQSVEEAPGEHTIVDGVNFTGVAGNVALAILAGDPQIRNCGFTGNMVAFGTQSAAAYLTNCAFYGNTNALESALNSVVQLSHCSFSNNIHSTISSVNSQLAAADCLFLNNTNSVVSGAINLYDSGANATRCVFAGNMSGAAYIDAGSSFKVSDSLLYGNSSVLGGAFNNNGTLTVVNCTVADNLSTAGGALANWGNAIFENSIVWNNNSHALAGVTSAQGEIYIVAGTVSAHNSLFQFNQLSGSFIANPFFANEAAGDYTLTSRSPAVGAGNNQYVQAGDTDLAGNPRIQQSTVDLGAFESSSAPNGIRVVMEPQPTTSCIGQTAVFSIVGDPGYTYQWQYNLGNGWTNVSNGDAIAGASATIQLNNTNSDSESSLQIAQVGANIDTLLVQALVVGQNYTSPAVALTVPPVGIIYVDASAPAGGDGTTWGTAYNSLLDALNVFSPCRSEIHVAQGTYTPTGTITGSYSFYGNFTIPPGAAIYGGFPTGGGSMASRNPAAYPTVLVNPTAASGGAIVFFDGQLPGGASTNWVLDGVVVEGNTNVTGVDVVDCSPILRNLTVRDCGQSGLIVQTAAGLVQNCQFLNNTGEDGAGAYLYQATSTFLNCAFQGNTSSNLGGGLYIAEESNPQLLDVLITGNRAAIGGGIYVDVGSPTMINSTVSGNLATEQCGGVAFGGSYNTFTIANSILWGNRSDSSVFGSQSLEQQQLFVVNPNAGNQFALANTTIYGLSTLTGPGLVGEDPNFVSPIDAAAAPTTNGNFQLSGCSPLLNAGNAADDGSIPADLNGQPRIIAGQVDFGPYELGIASGNPLMITAQPENLTYSGAGANTFSVSAQGDNLAYQWQIASPGGTFTALQNNAAFSGVTTSNLSINQLNLALSGSLVRCEVTSSEGCIAVSTEAVLTEVPGRYYVNAAMPDDSGDGLSWATAFKTLAHAASSPIGPTGSEFWCATGTYQGVALKSGTLLYGGFAGTETNLSQRNWLTNLAILVPPTNETYVPGGNPQAAVVFNLNDYVVYQSDGSLTNLPLSLARIDGFEIAGANTGMDNNEHATNVTIANCTFTNCDAGVVNTGVHPLVITNCLFENLGYGVVLDASSTVQNSTFVRNGTGLEANHGTANVAQCSFLGNTQGISAYTPALTVVDSSFATNWEGLHFAGNGGTLLLQRDSFRGNGSDVSSSGHYGGGLVLDQYVTAEADDCLFAGNYSPSQGAAVLNSEEPDVVFRNCTFAGNRNTAIWSPSGSVDLYNCVFWGNLDNSQPPYWWSGGNYSTSLYAQVLGYIGVQSNTVIQNGALSIDPYFISPMSAASAPSTNGDYHLTPCSGVLGLGATNQIGSSMMDLDSQPRLFAGTVTPGAYQPDSSLLSIALQPTNVVALSNAPVAFNAVPVVTTGAVYQWQVSVSGGAFSNVPNSEPYSGATTTQLAFSASSTEVGDAYRLQITYPSGCSIYSQSATFSLYQPTVAPSGVAPNAILAPSAPSFGFSLPNGVSTASVNDQSVAVYGAESGKLSFTDGSLLMNNGASLSLTAAHQFHPGEQVFVTVNSSVQSSNGFSASPRTWEFFNYVDSFDGYFNSPQNVSLNGNPTANLVQAGDLNRDGSIDLFVSTTTGCRVATNNGSGQFVDAGQTLGSDAASKIILGNVRGVGALDAVLVRDGAVEVWTNNGAGVFSQAADYSSVAVTGIALGDLNNDGFMDLFVLTTNDNRVWWNDGAGNFVDSGMHLASTNSAAVVLGDFNEDGWLDAMVVHSDATAPQLWLNQHGVSFVAGPANLPGAAGGYQRIIAANMFNSNHLDLVTIQSGQATAWRGNGDGTFSQAYTAAAVNPEGLCVGDINGDGRGDLVTTASGGTLGTEVSQTGGGFAPLYHQSAFGSASAATLADLNGDGALDLALITPSGQLQTASYQPVQVYGQEGVEATAYLDVFTTQFENWFDMTGYNPNVTFGGIQFLTSPTNGYLLADGSVLAAGDFYFDWFWGVQYIPYNGKFGMDSVTWKAIDYAYDTQTYSKVFKFNISIAPVVDVVPTNDYAIVSQGGSVSYLESGFTSVLSDVADINGTGLTASLQAPPSHGTVQLNSDGTFTYTQNGSGAHSDQFSYTATDQGTGHSANGTIYINIVNVNDTPQNIGLAQPAPLYPGLPAGQLVGTLSATDPDPAVPGFTYSLVSGTGSDGNAFFTISNNVLYTTAPLDTNASQYSIRVQATGLPDAYDGTGSSAQAVLTVNLQQLPVANPISISLPENEVPYPISLTGSGSGQLTFGISSPPTNGVLTGTPPYVYYQAFHNYSGPDAFSYYVTDGRQTSAVATVSIDIIFLNDQPPTVTNITAVTSENIPINLALLATPYVATDSISFYLPTGPTNGSLVWSSSNTFTYIPRTNSFGYDFFTYEVYDSVSGYYSAPATISITVNHVPQPPVARSFTFQAYENQSASIFLLGSNVDIPGPVTYRIVTPPQNGSVTLGAGTNALGQWPATYQPRPNTNGTDAFTYVVNNGYYDSAPATVTIHVAPEPVPVAYPEITNTLEGQSVTIPLLGADLENFPDLSLYFYVVTDVSHGLLLFDSTRTNLTYTPDANFYGTDTFSYIAYVGPYPSQPAEVQIVVIPPPPTAPSVTYTNYGYQNPFPIALQASDPNGLTLTYQILTTPQHGQLIATNLPYFFYSPDSNYWGTDNFTYQVYDANGTSSVATVTFDVIEPPHPPTVASFNTNAFLGIPITFSVSQLASDVLDDPLTIVSVQNVTLGTATFTSNLITYTPTNTSLIEGGSVAGDIYYTVSNRSMTATGFIGVFNMDRILYADINYSGSLSLPYYPSLSAALAEANSAGPGLPWLINVTYFGGFYTTLTNAEATSGDGSLSAFDITGNICIASGNAGGYPAVFKAGASLPMRFFQVEPGASLCLSNCVFFGGGANRGAAIYNQGNLTLLNTVFTNNSATAEGGAIYNLNGTVQLTNSSLMKNTAGTLGGGLYNVSGTVTMANSALTHNTAQNGGGLYQIGDAGAAALFASNSVISTNSATMDLVSTNADGGTASVNSTSLIVGHQTEPYIQTLAPSYLANGSTVMTLPAPPVGYQFAFAPTNPWSDGTALEFVGEGAQRRLVLMPPEQTVQPAQNVSLTLGNSNLSYTENFTLAFDPSAQLPPVTTPLNVAVNPFSYVTIPVLESAVNPDGPASQLSLVSVSTPRWGSATIVGTNIVYTNFNEANDTFTYVVSNGSLTATGAVYVQLAGNDLTVYYGGTIGGSALESFLQELGDTYYAGGLKIELQSNILVTSAVDQSVGPSAFVIGQNVTINGNGAAIQLAQGASPMRFFHVLPGATLTLSNLTLIGGIAPSSGSGAGYGGAIFNEGTVDLEKVNILGCRAQSSSNSVGLGGAIFNLGSVILNSTLLSSNAATDGGGIYQWADDNSVSVTMTNSTLRNAGTEYDLDATVTNAGSVSALLVNSTIQNPATPWVGDQSAIQISGSGTVPVFIGQGTNIAVVSASVADTNVVPEQNVTVSGTGPVRQLNVTGLNNGLTTVLVQATVGSNSFTRSLALSITGTNSLNPQVPPYYAIAYENSTVILNPLTNDYGDAPLQLLSVGGASNGIAALTNNEILYQNTGGTSDSFTYVVTNTYGGLATGQVYVTIETTIFNVTNSADQGPGTIYDLLSSLSNSAPGVPWTLHIDPSLAGQTITSPPGLEFIYGAAFAITNNITIDGSDAPGFTLAPPNYGYGYGDNEFFVYPGGTLTLINLQLTGAWGYGFYGGPGWYSYQGQLYPNSQQGGAIVNFGNLYVTNVVFTNNWVAGGYDGSTSLGNYNAYAYDGAGGGAICNDGGTAVVVGSTFVMNGTAGGPQGSTLSTNVLGNVGGALFNYNGSMTLISNTFAGNTAGSGAGVYTTGDGANASLVLQDNTMSNTVGSLDFVSTAFAGGQSSVFSELTNVMTQSVPWISTIGNQAVSNVDEVPFTFMFVSANPVLTVSSSDQSIVPDANLLLFTNGNSGVLRIVPGIKSGTCAITLQLSDGAVSYAQVFQAVVSAWPYPAVQFNVDPTNGMLPAAVSFTSPAYDSGNNAIVAWNWNFGDGSSSTVQNPTNLYTTAGFFHPVLLATNNLGQPILGFGPAININAPTISFTADATNGIAPLLVQFSGTAADSDGNLIAQWSWNFGDGTTSTEQNPLHNYTVANTYAPTLVMINTNGDTILGTGPSISVVPIVQNGSFESDDFTDWIVPQYTPSYVDVGQYMTPDAGDCEAVLRSSYGPMNYISQTVPTSPGMNYLLSFWLSNPYGDSGEFNVSFDGNTVFDTNSLPEFGWTNMQFVVVSTGSQTVLQFGVDDNNSYGFGLDNITLTPLMVTNPVIVWTNPPPINYGRPLPTNDLNATASVPGHFVYDPPAGTVLDGGTDILASVFYPDVAGYASVTSTVQIVVLPLNQVINFGSITDQCYGAAPFDISATASSGLPVTFSIVNGQATISGNTVTITGTGPVTIEADQPGDNDYLPAASVDQTFYVNPQVQVVTNISDSGPGSLRAAIEMANSIPGNGQWYITFATNLAGQMFALSNADDQSFGPSALIVSNQITIDGSGVPGLSIGLDPSAPPMRLFHVAPGGSLSIVNLVLQDGQAVGGNGSDGSGGGGGGAGFGGAIYNEGSLALNTVTLTNNTALGGQGGNWAAGDPGAGGLPNGGSDPNMPPGYGGGAAGSSECGGSAGTGGGGAIFNNGGTVNMTGCLVINNTAQGNVGGIGMVDCSGTNSSGLGGGFFNFGGSVTVTGCLFTNNTADLGAGICSLGDTSSSLYLYNDVLFAAGSTNDLYLDAAGGGQSTVFDGNSVIDTQDSPWVNGIANIGTITPGKTFVVNLPVQLPADANSYTVSAHSTNQTLFPDANLVVTQDGTNWTLTVQPAIGQTGMAAITVSVGDGMVTASTTFTVAEGLFVSVAATGPDRVLSCVEDPSLNITAQFTTNFITGSWTDLGAVMEMSPGNYQFRDIAPTNSIRFYRLVAH